MAELQQGLLPQAYSYLLRNNHCWCAKGTGHQTVVNLWEADELSTFHDAELASATKQINTIIEKIQKNNKDPKRTLSLIQFQNRHFLVWATYGAITPYDEDDTIIKALKLKTK